MILLAFVRVVQEEAFVDRRRMPRGHVAALAEERQLRDEHPVVVAAVRVVARHAGVRDRRVLPQIRSALLGVAAGAALVDRRADLQQPDVGRPMRVVARGAVSSPSRTGMWLNRCCLLTMFWWQVAHSSPSATRP